MKLLTTPRSEVNAERRINAPTFLVLARKVAGPEPIDLPKSIIFSYEMHISLTKKSNIVVASVSTF
jgi:hypothetical protein